MVVSTSASGTLTLFSWETAFTGEGFPKQLVPTIEDRLAVS